MRLYSITNMYTAGIHAGIQTQHSTVELFLKYKEESAQKNVLWDWAEFHKTTVVLTGGMHEHLQDLLVDLVSWQQREPELSLPFAGFREIGINNALSSISIVMPQDVIDFMSLIRSTKPETPEREALMLEVYDTYGRSSYNIFEKIAFYQLAK